MSSTERWQTVLYVRELERRYGSQATAEVKPAEPGPHRNMTDSDATYTDQGSDSP
jgi:hypothetical protein